MSEQVTERTVDESLDLVDQILNSSTSVDEYAFTDSADTSVVSEVAEDEENVEAKETDDTITSDVDNDNDDTNDGVDENSDDSNEEDVDDQEDIDDQEDTQTGEEVEDDSVGFSEALVNLGIESEDKIIELHESWAASQKKLEKYSEKEELFYLLEQEKIDNVMDLAVAIKAASGDMSALNKILKDNNIEAVDLITGEDEIDEFKYDDSKISKSKEKASDEEMFVAATTIAATKGVKDEFVEKVGSWDKGSFRDVVSSQKNASIMATEIKTGRFDEVMKKVNVLRNSDFSNKYRGKDDLDMYKIASDMIGSTDKKREIKEPAKKSTKKSNTPKKEVKNSKRIDKAIKAAEQSAASSVVSSSTETEANSNQKSAFASDEELFAYVDSL